jgi:hypothetical protein
MVEDVEFAISLSPPRPVCDEKHNEVVDEPRQDVFMGDIDDKII